MLTPVGEYKSEALEQAKQIIRNRVDGLGVGEPEITRQGNAIVVALPGVKDQNKALEVVGQTAELRFRPVLERLPADETTPIPQLAPSTTVVGASTTAGASTTTGASTTAGAGTTAASSTTAAATPGKAIARAAASTSSTPASASTATATTSAAGATTTVVGASTTAAAPTSTSPVVTITEAIPSTKPEDDAAAAEVILPEKDSSGKVTARYRLGPTFLTGSGVNGATTDFQNLEYSVNLSLKGGSTGIDLFNAMAAKCYSGQSAECPPLSSGSAARGAIAIVLDSVVVSAPQINAASFQADQISITGNFKQSDADSLSLVLRYGALPVKLEPQAVQTVSATLGKDSLRAGVFAGLVGVGLVIVFMLFYYRSLALVVLAGLVVSAAILWALISWTNATLTLSGATGIIVSIGVTVDSYVVFFERLKDDVRAGKTLRSSASRGFASAWHTIVAADSVSLLGAAVLYWLTVGSVRGFAFFLGLSTLIDLLVAYFFTRPAVRLLSLSNYFRGDKVLGVTAGESVAGGVA